MKKNFLCLILLILVFNQLYGQNPGVANSSTSNYIDVLRYTGQGNYCDEGITFKTNIPTNENLAATFFIKGFIIEDGTQKLVDIKIHFSGNVSSPDFSQANNTGNYKPEINWGSHNTSKGDFLFISFRNVNYTNTTEANIKVTALSEAQNLTPEWFNDWNVECFNSMYGNIIPYSINEFGSIKAEDVEISSNLYSNNIVSPYLNITSSGTINFLSGSMATYNYVSTSFLNSANGHFTNSLSIGTTSTNPNYKLLVDGAVGVRKLKVTQQSNWADYVFNRNYNLMPLNKLEQYIKTNKHLPDIPTTEEVQKDGVDIGEIQAKLLQKVEELTLYVIEQEKKIKNQEVKLKQLQLQLKSKRGK